MDKPLEDIAKDPKYERIEWQRYVFYVYEHNGRREIYQEAMKDGKPMALYLGTKCHTSKPSSR